MSGGPTEERLRRQLCRLARRLYDRGLITGLDGNLSARFEGRWVVATPSAIDKAGLEPEDMVLLDLGPDAARGGTPPDDPRLARARRGMRPTSETAMHLAVYRARSDISAVVHAHPPNAVGLTFARPHPRLDVCPEAVVLLGEVGYAEYATPGTDELAQSIAPLVGRCDAMLLSRHGAVTLGADLTLAYQRMEVLEHVARILVTARQLGPVDPLPEQEKRRLRQMAGRVDPPAEGDAVVRQIERVVREVLAEMGR